MTACVNKLLNIYLTKKCLHFRGNGDIIKSSKRYLYFFIFLPLFSLETPPAVWSTAGGVFVKMLGCEKQLHKWRKNMYDMFQSFG